MIAALRLRIANPIPTARWDDYAGAYHDRAGMVAGAVKADLITDLLAAVEAAKVNGTGFTAFQSDFRAIVEKHGWHGWTGEGTAKGEAWRMKVIYRTNVSTAYAAGRWAQLKARGFKLLVYRHSGSEHPRLQHLAWNGLVVPIDHPFWVAHYPPNGWGCRCKVRGAMSPSGARDLGGDPSKDLPADWDKIDPRTGAPPGIGKGWDHAPGRTVEDAIRTMAAKAVNWPYEVGKAFMADLPDGAGDLFARTFRSLPSQQNELRRFVERVLGERNGAPIDPAINVEPQRSLGLLTAAERDQVRALTGTDPRGFDFTVDRDAIIHIRNRHSDAALEASRNQRPVEPADYRLLAELLISPDTVERGEEGQGRQAILKYTRRIGNDRIVALFEVRTGRKRLSLVTFWIERVAG
jgi:SPP1 gp7 family putative phage head morphogenesis protein